MLVQYHDTYSVEIGWRLPSRIWSVRDLNVTTGIVSHHVIVRHFQNVLISFQVACRDQVGIDVFASQVLPQSLRPFESFPIDGDITRLSTDTIELPIRNLPSSFRIPYSLSRYRLFYRYGVRYSLAISPKCFLPNARPSSSMFASLSSLLILSSSWISKLLPWRFGIPK